MIGIDVQWPNYLPVVALGVVAVGRGTIDFFSLDRNALERWKRPGATMTSSSLSPLCCTCFILLRLSVSSLSGVNVDNFPSQLSRQARSLRFNLMFYTFDLFSRSFKVDQTSESYWTDTIATLFCLKIKLQNFNFLIIKTSLTNCFGIFRTVVSKLITKITNSTAKN